MEHVPPLAVRRRSQLLAMGFAMAPLGFVFGFLYTAVPILLAAQNIPVHIIENAVVVALLPTSIGFLICPILDVRFTRRFYIVVCAIVSALALGTAVMEYRHLVLFTALATLSCTSAVLLGNALNGWIVDALPSSDFGWMGTWTNIANLGAAGVFGSFSVHLIRSLPLPAAAALLAAVVLLPLVLLAAFPEPVQPHRTGAETFRTLFRDIRRLLGQRACLLGLAAFLLPTSCFALTNLFSALGKDFHAPESYVANMTGVGVAIACSIGTLVGAPLCNRFSRGHIYVVVGFAGALCSTVMIFVPHTLTTFTVDLLAYNFVQGINYTAFSAFSLDLTGKHNPLAATQISVLTASANLPILYMSYFEGHAHDRFGLNAMFAIDAGASIAAATLLLYLFHRFHIGKGPLVQPDAAVGAS
jgi:PAT family beta-lactamase induction signal transducer AmpG